MDHEFNCLLKRCGKAFTSRRSNSKYCSDVCRATASRLNRKEALIRKRRRMGQGFGDGLPSDLTPDNSDGNSANTSDGAKFSERKHETGRTKTKPGTHSGSKTSSRPSSSQDMNVLNARVTALESGGLLGQDLRGLLIRLGHFEGKTSARLKRQDETISVLEVKIAHLEEELAKAGKQYLHLMSFLKRT